MQSYQSKSKTDYEYWCAALEASHNMQTKMSPPRWSSPVKGLDASVYDILSHYFA